MLTMIITAILLAILVFGSYAACVETSTRNKQYRDGTHDYYGNKLDDKNIQGR